MIVIWRRWGPLGLIFLVLGFLLWVAIAAVYREAFSVTEKTGWWQVASLIVGFGIGAAANWLFAAKVVEPRLDKPGAYPPVPASTLFFMTLRQWTWGIVAVGILFLIPNFFAALQS